MVRQPRIRNEDEGRNGVQFDLSPRDDVCDEWDLIKPPPYSARLDQVEK